MGHGILSFYVCKAFDLSGVACGSNGLIWTLFSALVFEVLENSDYIVNLFRENSGGLLYYVYWRII